MFSQLLLREATPNDVTPAKVGAKGKNRIPALAGMTRREQQVVRLIVYVRKQVNE